MGYTKIDKVKHGEAKYRFDVRLLRAGCHTKERCREVVTCSPSAVEFIYMQWKADLTGVKPTKFFENVDKFIDHLSTKLQAKDFTEAFFNNAVQRLNYAKSYFKDIELQAIQHQQVDNYRLSLKAKGLKPATVNAYIKVLFMCFKWCIRNNYYIGNNPASDLTVSEDSSVRKIELSEEQYQEIITKSRDYPKLHTVIMIALLTGMRRGEVFKLCWSDVDFTKNIIHVRAENSKSGNAREIPLTPDLKKHLLEVKISTRSVTVISGYGCAKKITKDWIKFREWLSFGVDLHFHDLRHIFGQRLLEHGLDILDISQWMGHSSPTITLKRYANIQRRSNFNKISVLDGQYLVNE